MVPLLHVLDLSPACRSGSVRFFRHVSPQTSHDFVSDFPLSVCGEVGNYFSFASAKDLSTCEIPLDPLSF